MFLVVHYQILSFVLHFLCKLRNAHSACRHPLFPLLELLFEKCEQATTMSWEQDQSSNTVNYALYTVNAEIAAFTQKVSSSILRRSRVDGRGFVFLTNNSLIL